MYLYIAFAVMVLVIVLAWRGVGNGRIEREDRPEYRIREVRQQRPTKPAPRKFVAPDDNPEFLSEIDRKLRDEGKNA